MTVFYNQPSFTRRPDRMVHLNCDFSGVPLQNSTVPWCLLKEGEPLEWILYGSAKNHRQDHHNSHVEADEEDNDVFYLIINNVPSDEPTYCCAFWGSECHRGRRAL